jgi:NAD(P)-dependent dehydrogenase (short-subunit alcohol dehydrogenase family)
MESDMKTDLLNLAGKTALVTGASRGIGYGIALILAQHGARVAVASLHKEGAIEAAGRISGETGTNCIGFGMDVRSAESVKSGFKELRDRFGGLDILINNAGVANSIDIADLDEDAWDRVMDTNLKGTYLCCREAVSLLAEEGASIVNIASISGSMVNVPNYQASYNASKAGVIHFTRSLAVELAPRNVRVNSVSPGYTLTDMNRRPEVQDLIAVWEDRTPMKRMAKVEEIASAALFLVSEMAGFVTGHDLVVDGGITTLC